LISTVSEGWGLDIASFQYLPVGHGSYHWAATSATGNRYFVTADDLGQKSFLGEVPDSAFAGPRAAFDTALALSREGGLDFVVAPVPTLRGETVQRIDATYAVAVFPFVAGNSRAFDGNPTPEERADVVEMLVRLHQATPSVASIARPVTLRLPARSSLESALRDLAAVWNGGPLSEPARALLAGHDDTVVGVLKDLDRLAVHVAKAGSAPVISHGEPHPGNVIHVDGRCVLVDWDTAGLAPPERDLWMVDSGTGRELVLYADKSGRQIDQEALAVYRLLWRLDDIAGFVSQLRSAHDQSPDTEQALESFGKALLGESGPRSISPTVHRLNSNNM
jgi:spectinomycin phosphotransferase